MLALHLGGIMRTVKLQVTEREFKNLFRKEIESLVEFENRILLSKINQLEKNHNTLAREIMELKKKC